MTGLAQRHYCQGTSFYICPKSRHCLLSSETEPGFSSPEWQNIFFYSPSLWFKFQLGNVTKRNFRLYYVLLKANSAKTRKTQREL